MKLKKTEWYMISIQILFVLAVAGGWIANIIKLVTYDGAFGLVEVVRAIGIVAAPLGVVMGYI